MGDPPYTLISEPILEVELFLLLILSLSPVLILSSILNQDYRRRSESLKV